MDKSVSQNISKLSLGVFGCSNAARSDGPCTVMSDPVKGILVLLVGMRP